MNKIEIEGININIESRNNADYISLTDMAKSQHENIIITKWLSAKNTIEYIGEWEAMYNENFNYTEFGIIKNTSGGNNYVLSVKEWLEKTNAIGITAKAGRYGGTYAHKDIAFHFGMWISPRFQLLLVKEFQRLKEEESLRLNSEWDYKRFLSKVNYKIHTDAIKEVLVPIKNLPKEKEGIVYAEEAELLNYALFGVTSKEWKASNMPETLQGRNIRDYADAHQLIVLSNLESMNAEMVRNKLDVKTRLIALRQVAINQLTSLKNSNYTVDKIKSPFKLSSKAEKGKNN